MFSVETDPKVSHLLWVSLYAPYRDSIRIRLQNEMLTKVYKA